MENSEMEEVVIGGGRKVKQEFLGEGSYGCSYLPGITCAGKTGRNRNYITKIQTVNETSLNEWNISQTIKKIKQYNNRFAPIIKNV